jgi:hypothetical protein
VSEDKKKVVFCIPTITKPYKQTLDALAASVPLIEAAGWEHALVHEIGNPYISAARANMLRKALDAKATHVVFIDHDVSWRPEDMLKLLETEGDVVAGTYRFKKDEETYMGSFKCDTSGRPTVRESDGALKATAIPAGFLKITRACVSKFMEVFPELCYGERCNPSVDLFNHGAHNWQWFGEDFSFARRWVEDCNGEIWLIPDMNIAHTSSDGTTYDGNLHRFLLKQPGGSESNNPIPPSQR